MFSTVLGTFLLKIISRSKKSLFCNYFASKNQTVINIKNICTSLAIKYILTLIVRKDVVSAYLGGTRPRASFGFAIC